MQKNQTKHSPPKISVVVSTQNRQLLLDTCIQSLLHQSENKNTYEIIIVDNRSHDDTMSVVQKYAKHFKNIRYIYEKKNGISIARNTGWKHARHEFVAFIDDDAYAEKNYIHEIRSFTFHHPDVFIFGGPFRRYSSVQISEWFPPNYGSKDLGKKERPIRLGKEWITGTNLIVSKRVLKRIGGFDKTLVDPKGDFVYGEDTRFLMDARQNGEVIWYSPRIRVFHHVSKEKMSLQRLLKNDFQMGKTIVYVHNRKDTIWYHGASLVHKVGLFAYYLLKPTLMPFKRRTYYACRGLFSWAGAFCIYIGIFPKIGGKEYSRH